MTTPAQRALRSPVLAATLTHLRALVACDTQNPPRAAAGIAALFAYAEPLMAGAGFSTQVRELGHGCAWLYAVRGAPRVLVNVHVDTVPAAPGYTADPHTLRVNSTHAIGLGACDIKGALAAWLVAAGDTRGDASLLLTTDEEAGSSLCMRTFLDERHHHGPIIVSEPTQNRAVTAHRGIGTATAMFSGTPGHASLARALVDSANHAALRFGAALLAHADAERARGNDLRLNIGVVAGGQKANMIAGEALLRFGVRPPPGQDAAAVIRALAAIAPDPARVHVAPGFLAPALPAAGHSAAAAEQLAVSLGLELAPPVDFFTEAAFVSAAGVPAFVYGPGNIDHAHTADEHVELTSLVEACAFYTRLLSDPGGSG